MAITDLFTFTRSSVGTYFDSNGVMQTAGNDQLRFDSRGVLLESVATNLVLWSETFGNAAWNKVAVNTTNDLTLAPDGVTLVDKVDLTGISAIVYQVFTVTAGTTYTFSYWCKLATASQNRNGVYDHTNNAWIVAAAASNATSSGFSRVSITFTVPVGCTQVRCYISRADTSYMGSCYIWGAQLETGTFASSYIKTTSSTATRANETLTTPVDTLDLGEGTAYFEAYAIQENYIPFAGIDNGTKNAAPHLRFSMETGKSRLYITTPTNVVKSKTGSYTIGTGNLVRFAVSWTGSIIRVCMNGGAVESLDVSESFSTFTLSRLLVGDGAWFNTHYCIISKLKLSTSTISDTLLQKITE